jgi:hypothetical protein
MRLKVSVVSTFLVVFILFTIPISSLENVRDNFSLLIPISIVVLTVITILLILLNVNRLAMHTANIAILILTIYYTRGDNHFYGFILFFIALTILIFFQDILAYLFYGLGIVGFGVYYLNLNGMKIVGENSINPAISILTYHVALIGFFLLFLIQFLLSDSIYEKMNREWVRMNRLLRRYQDYTFGYIEEIEEENEVEPVWKDNRFQKTVHEISLFINQFFEKDAEKISEVVEYYFFLHTQELSEILENKEANIFAKRYAIQMDKYLLNHNSEMIGILLDFSTLFMKENKYTNKRYDYNLDRLLRDSSDKLLFLAILYRFLKREVTRFDKWGKISETLSHDEITNLFKSSVFREFITYEQLNFYLDNEELFRDNL